MYIDVYHCTLVVNHREYSFGMHPDRKSGIFQRDLNKSHKKIGKLKKELVMGETNLWRYQLDFIIDRLGNEKYAGKNYQSLRRNCNHFVNDMLWILTGKSIPLWITRAERTMSSICTLSRFQPKQVENEWITDFIDCEQMLNGSMDSAECVEIAEPVILERRSILETEV